MKTCSCTLHINNPGACENCPNNTDLWNDKFYDTGKRVASFRDKRLYTEEELAKEKAKAREEVIEEINDHLINFPVAKGQDNPDRIKRSEFSYYLQALKDKRRK